MQWRAQFDAPPDDLALLQSNDRSLDFDLRFRPRAHADQFLEHAVILRPAIRITRTVFRHCADVNRAGANRFRPADGHGKKMRVSKRNVGYGNRAAVWARRAQLIFRNGNALVRERRSTNRAKVIELHDETLSYLEPIGNLFEGAPLTPLCALAVTRMQETKVLSTVLL